MKKILFALSLLLSMNSLAQQQGYTIRGTAEGTVDGDTVYLCNITNFFAINRIDSTIVKDGEYLFKGEFPGCAFRYIMPTHNGSNKGLAFAAIMLENADITVKSFLSEKKQDAIVTGGQNTQLWQEFKKIQKKWSEKEADYWLTTRDTTVSKAQQQAAQHSLDSLILLQKEEENEFMIAHLPAPYCDIILGSNFKSLYPEKQKKVMALFKEKSPETPNYKRLVAEMEAIAPTAVGQHYTDFAMPDPEGNELKISQVVEKNKYTLVDFWASWCGPCRAEMPNVVEAYNQYHDKGFEVVGVSLDNKKDAWVEAIGKLEMPWPQMSDLKGWQSEGAKIYSVRAIPANVLINQKGEIIARDLRGLTLVNTIADLLK